MRSSGKLRADDIYDSLLFWAVHGTWVLLAGIYTSILYLMPRLQKIFFMGLLHGVPFGLLPV